MGCNERKPSPSLAAWVACEGSPRQELLRRPCIPQWSSHKWQWWFQNLFLYKFLLLSPLPSAIWINPLCKSKYCLKLSSIANNIFLKTLPLLLSLTTNALIGGKSVYSSLLPPSRSYTAKEIRWWDAGVRVFCVLTAPQIGRARADTE